jgi:hypothetical protein
MSKQLETVLLFLALLLLNWCCNDGTMAIRTKIHDTYASFFTLGAASAMPPNKSSSPIADSTSASASIPYLSANCFSLPAWSSITRICGFQRGWLRVSLVNCVKGRGDVVHVVMLDPSDKTITCLYNLFALEMMQMDVLCVLEPRRLFPHRFPFRVDCLVDATHL